MMRHTARIATAYHEAGHAVAALVKEIKFRHVTICPAAGSVGHVQFLARPPRALATLHARGVVAMAGEAAQRQHNQRSLRQHHGAGDRAAVIAYAFDASGSARQAELLATLWGVQALELVETRWEAIERVATALTELHTLTMDEVRKLTYGGAVSSPSSRGAASPI